MQLDFKPITPQSRAEVQSVTFAAGLRNCNFTFANLYGWQTHFGTCYAVVGETLVLRFRFGESMAHIVCSRRVPDRALLESLADADGHLCLLALEDDRAAAVAALFPGRATVTPMRDSYDYLYLRSELASVAGKSLKNKRNHINKFRTEHPGFEYRDLTPDLFDRCRQLERLWRDASPHENPDYGDTIDTEQRVIERVFANWDALGMQGGCIFVDDELVAFTYGCPVTPDTFDVCVEKADRRVDGAFSIINQQFAAHLPESYLYLNREEDMGLEGLRKAKLSYHPAQLITFNSLTL